MKWLDRAPTTNRLLLIVAAFLIVVSLKLAQPVIIALLLTILLVYVMEPIVSLLQRARSPLWLAILSAVVLLTAFFAGLFLLLVRDFSHFGRTFPRFQQELVNRAQAVLEALENAFGAYLTVNPFEELRTLPIGQGMLATVRSTARIISEFFLIFFFAVLLLLGKHSAMSKIRAIFPKKNSLGPVILRHIDRHLRIFLGIKALAGLAVGLGTGLILYLFRVEFAVTWGFLAFLLNFVPTLGPIIAVLLPILIAFVQFNGWILPLVIAACLAFVHLTVSTLIEPKFMGQHLNLSFFIIFLSLFFWGWLWGPAGVLLGVPLTTSLKIILERVPSTSRFAALLESSRKKALLLEVEERFLKTRRKKRAAGRN
jgi:AI-2 transport protein TqsA